MNLLPALGPSLRPSLGLAINRGALPGFAALLITEEGQPILAEESQTIQQEAPSNA